MNDPFPFALIGLDPYLLAGGSVAQPGSYWIGYSDFRSRLVWAESFIVRRQGVWVSSGSFRGNVCCFVAGATLGSCPVATAPLPWASPCLCDYGPGGLYFGSVCR